MLSKWLLLVCLVRLAECANILAVLPTISKSHFLVFEPLVVELARRGHNVTVLTTFPPARPVNYAVIDVKLYRESIFNNLSVSEAQEFRSTFTTIFHYINNTENVLYAPPVLSLNASTSKFDLILLEMFLEDIFLGFSHRFSAPAIALGSCYMFPWVVDRFHISANPSHVPSFGHMFKTHMSFLSRLYNTYVSLYDRLFYKYFIEPKSSEMVRKYFGSNTPRVGDLVTNTSMYFMNTHFSFFGAFPHAPNVVDVSGIHLKPPEHLDQELDKWMNESSEGVIYFSFGSMLRGATLPSEKVQAFLHVFQSLPQRVLWKWEDDTVDNLPNNVKIMKWIPQRDVLAHPKVKVFISHGGLLGTTEAVVSGVPILGIPMYGDQPNNVAALVENGVAVHVDYNNISVASLSYALRALLYDKSYRDNAKLLSHRFLDRPMSPLDTAVYWTEYVIRHRGAPHLQSAAVHLTWYEYYLLDVIAILIAAVVATLWIVYYVISSCLKLVRPSKSAKLKSN